MRKSKTDRHPEYLIGTAKFRDYKCAAHELAPLKGEMTVQVSQQSESEWCAHILGASHVMSDMNGQPISGIIEDVLERVRRRFEKQTEPYTWRDHTGATSAAPNGLPCFQ